MKTLVTGATGFLGERLVKRLLGKGEDLALFVRDPEKAEVLFSETPDLREGDLKDPSSIEKALEGCDRMYHCASLVSMWEKDPSIFEKVNVEGTGKLLKTALEKDVKKVVYTSSFMALGPSDPGIMDEGDERQDFDFHNEYERTKYLADEVAENFSERGLPIVRLYPGVIYGPGLLTEGNLVGGIVKDYLSDNLPGTIGPGDREWCYSYIDDVIEGHIAAMEKGEPGERYILGGDNRTMNELLDILEKKTGKEKPGAHLPYWLCYIFGLLYVLRAKIFGKKPRFTPGVVQIYRHAWAYSSKRAKEELDYQTTGLEEGIANLLEWIEGSSYVD